MRYTIGIRKMVALLSWAVIIATISGPLTGDDEKSSAQDGSIKQKIHRLTETAHSAKDFSQIVDQCQLALDGQLIDADRAYLTTLKSWALIRRCEKRIELGAEFIAAGNDRQGLIVKDEALADAMEAISLDETRWRGFLNRGTLLADAGLWSEALTDFETVCRLQPEESVGWFNCGEIHSALQHFPEAVASYDRALAKNSADLQALTGRGLARYRLRDYENALQDFEIVTRMRNSDSAAFVNRGDARLGLGQWRDAHDDYSHAAQIDDNGIAAERMAWLFATCPEAEYYRPGTALDLAQHSMATMGETVGNLEALAAAHACQGDFDQAALAQRKAIQCDPTGLAERAERLKMYEQQKPFVQQTHRVETGQMRTSTPEAETTDDR